MSASDKKQQRKAEQADGLTQRQQRERAEAQSAKQKKTIYATVGVVCAVAAAALLVWNNMGSFRNNAVAATVDGVDYKVSDLQYYYVSARNYSQYLYSMYGSMLGYDANVSDGEQYYSEADGTTYADYFRDSALQSLKQTSILCAAADEAGYTLSEDGQKEIDEQLSQIDAVCAQNGLTRSSYFARVYGKGVTEKVFVRNLTNDTLAREYSQYYQDSISYDEAALKDYYDEHPDSLDSYDYRVFTVTADIPASTDAEGNEVEVTDEEKAAAMEAAKKLADEAVAEIKAGEDVEKAFIEAAPKYVAESSKGAYESESYSLQEGVLGSNLSSGGSAIATWLMDSTRKTGDVAAIEATNGYQVVLFLDRYLVTDPTVNIRHILIKAETSDGDETDENGSKIPSQAEMDAAKTEAQALLDEWKAGEATAESFGELAKEHSDDGGSASNGGEYKYVTKGWAFEGFNDWCFDSARQPGDTGLVENPQSGQQGWHIMYFEKVEEPAWKGTAISAIQETSHSEWLTGLSDAAVAETADGMKYVGEENNVAPVESEAPAESGSPTESEAPADESAAASPAA